MVPTAKRRLELRGKNGLGYGDVELGSGEIPALSQTEVCETESIPLDIYDIDEELVITAQLPGFQEDDLNVGVNPDGLTIRAVKKQDKTRQNPGTDLCEPCYGEYHRTVSMHAAFNSDDLSVTFANGTLELVMPRPTGVQTDAI